MRELTKSFLSYTWAQSLFGVQQMLNLLTPQGSRQNHPATDAFNNVAQTTGEAMGGLMGATFRAGDNIQRGMVDMMFGVLTLGNSGRGGGGGGGGRGRGTFGGGDWASAASNAGQQTAEAFRQGMRGMGQTADVVGQAVGGAGAGAAGRWGQGGDAGAGQGQGQGQSTGWGPVPPPPSSSGGGR